MSSTPVLVCVKLPLMVTVPAALTPPTISVPAFVTEALNVAEPYTVTPVWMVTVVAVRVPLTPVPVPGVAPKETWLALVKPLPVIVTLPPPPVGPDVLLRPVTVGAADW